jgi:hypothetical protein
MHAMHAKLLKQHEILNEQTKKRCEEFHQQTSEDIVTLQQQLERLRNLKKSVKTIVDKIHTRRAAEQQGGLDDFSALREHNVAPDLALAAFRGAGVQTLLNPYDEVFTIRRILEKEQETNGNKRYPEVIDAPSYYWYTHFHVFSQELVEKRENIHEAICKVFQECLDSKTEVRRTAVYAHVRAQTAKIEAGVRIRF